MIGKSETPKIFVRQASGLVREFGVADTFIYNTLGYALGLVLATAPTFLGSLQPNANIYWVLTIGTILTLCNGIVYGLFSAAMPRSGGDYLFVGRTLNPGLGFVANWGFSWSQFLGIGVYTAWCVGTALSPALSTVGYSLSNKSLISLGIKVSSPLTLWVIGTILLGTVLFVTLSGMRTLKRFLNILFFVALIGTLAMMYVFLTTSHEEFIKAFNEFMGDNANLKDAYNEIIKMGTAKGLAVGTPTDFWSALLALPVGYWVFIGFTYSVYIGGEVKEPQKSQSIGIIGSLLFGYVVYMITMGTYYNVVGHDFNNAVALIQNIEGSPLPVGGSMSFFAGILTKNVTLNILMGLSTFLWFYLLLFVMVSFCVRNIFAWSFDRIMPESLTKITKKKGSPWVATLVIVGIAELFLTVQAFWGIAFINYIALFSVCFLITGIAAILFPYRRKSLFNNSPKIVKKRIFGVPLLVVAGIGNTLLFTIVLYSSLTNPGVSGVQGTLPIFVILGIYGLGYAVFFISKQVRKRQSINLDDIYNEIPPE